MFLTRRKIQDGSEYLGPFTSVARVRELILFIKQHIQLRTCKLTLTQKNIEAKKFFDIGIETLHLNSTLNKKFLIKTRDVFLRAYEIDSTFCDAIFFAGYTSKLIAEDRKFPLACYYIADSLSSNKSTEFKVNLAAEGLKRNEA